MSAPVKLRTDFGGSDLRRFARASGDAAQVRRLLALASIYEAPIVARQRGLEVWTGSLYGTGLFGSTPEAQRAWWMARHLAPGRY